MDDGYIMPRTAANKDVVLRQLSSSLPQPPRCRGRSLITALLVVSPAAETPCGQGQKYKDIYNSVLRKGVVTRAEWKIPYGRTAPNYVARREASGTRQECCCCNEVSAINQDGAR